jgi:mRNA interferase MazF
MSQLRPGQIFWFHPDDTRGREMAGRRPWITVSTAEYMELVTSLVVAIPCTAVDRGWVNHVPVTGVPTLRRPTFAMTEQPTTVAKEAILDVGDCVDALCLEQIGFWLDRWITRTSATPAA